MLCFIRFGTLGAFAFCYLHSGEYFPTVFRGVMFGICNAAARFGGILAPEFSALFFPHCFMLVFALLAVLMFFLNFTIYETKGRPVQDNVHEPTTSTERNSTQLQEKRLP